MSHRLSSVVGALVFLAVAGTVRAAELTPLQIADTRMASLTSEPLPFGPRSGLAITCKVSGTDVKDPTSWGRINLTEAKDDTGQDIKAKGREFFDKAMNTLWEGSIAKKDGSFQVVLNLGSPDRKATKITSVKGEFVVLAGGEKKQAKIAKPTELYGKKIEDATLKAAGIEVNVEPKDTRGSTPDQGMSMKITGNTDALIKALFVDKDGKELQGNQSWNKDEKTQVLHYFIWSPSKIDDTQSLQLTVVVGQKKVTVPVDLKDVKLP